MSFILPFFGTILGIMGAIAIISLIIFYKVSKTIGKSNLNELMNAVRNVSNIEEEEYSRIKDVSGMTSLLEPLILEDFPEFNKELMFNIVEENLRKILNAIQNKNMEEIENDDNLSFIKENIKKVIEDYKQSNINIEYRNIEFHRHAIKDYRKSNGKATITISSSVGYYYKSNKKDEKIFENRRKETRYITQFCYIYDEVKFDDKVAEFSISCPNCGAPIRETKNMICEYCGSPVEAINLKAWKIISYKEDYK